MANVVDYVMVGIGVRVSGLVHCFGLSAAHRKRPAGRGQEGNWRAAEGI